VRKSEGRASHAVGVTRIRGLATTCHGEGGSIAIEEGLF